MTNQEIKNAAISNCVADFSSYMNKACYNLDLIRSIMLDDEDCVQQINYIWDKILVKGQAMIIALLAAKTGNEIAVDIKERAKS